MRGRSGGVGAEAMAGVEGVGAPVSGGVGLWLERRRGMWRRHSVGAERGKIASRGRKFDRRRRLCFKGEQRGGGVGVGAVWRRSGRERRRGGT
jgi:hypothetical protein